MKKPAIYQIEQPAPNVTAIARFPNTELPVKYVKMRCGNLDKPVVPQKLFGTSNGTEQVPYAPMNRR